MSVDCGIEDLAQLIDWHLSDVAQSEAYWKSIHISPDRTPLPFFEILPSATATAAPTVEIDHCLDRARKFLCFDLESRESWEIQRTGLWARDLLVGDVFSRALVAESLAECGMAVPEMIEAILYQYRDNGWRYYRDFKALPPDIDDIAQAIRLLNYTDWDNKKRNDFLEKPLRWLAVNQTSDGGFPVWLTHGVEDEPEGGWVPLGGFRCIACEANLLSAFADGHPKKTGVWLVDGVKSILDLWDVEAYSGIYYYKPTIGSAIVALCLSRSLKKEDADSAVIEQFQDKLQILAEHRLRPTSAQDSLSLAAQIQIQLLTREPPIESINQTVAVLKSRQSFDGGWEAVDYFRCPGSTSHSIGWHRGRLLTTQYITRVLAQIVE
ncbi:MAG: hypothetical protein HOC74_10580 [Gemmatimonadetes bacterium]|nr:hypothetical protein [Deltaproteobacteria bacterium]MBT4498159.1 hypothetical protein [Gemmatimonadota bacterium]